MYPLNAIFSHILIFKRKTIRASMLILCLMLASCSADEELANLKPVSLNETLNTTYQQTCATCHTNPATGAPQAHKPDQWRDALSKGLDAALERTINGFGGMPPGGQCFECSPEELRILIVYMSQSPDKEQ